MKIISWNVNGLRAVLKRGFLDWLKNSKAGIVCLQEIKLQEKTLPPELTNPAGYFSFFNFAQKLGYSGVAVFSKQKPLTIEKKLGFGRFDEEGRILKLKYPDFTLIILYLPHGGRQKENLNYKLEVYRHLLDYLKKIKNQKVFLIGDFNIAHAELDLARPRENKNNIMFTLEERRQIDKIINLGFCDTFRKFHRDGGHYTWWPYFASARQRNLGWRIDYAFASRKLTPRLKDAFILPGVLGSDHCPVGIEMSKGLS